MSKTVRIMDIDCEVVKNVYNQNRNQICLSLVSADTDHNLKNTDTFPGEPVSKPTVNLGDVGLKENETLIVDDFDGSLSTLEALSEAEIVRPTGMAVEYGFNQKAYVVYVLI